MMTCIDNIELRREMYKLSEENKQLRTERDMFERSYKVCESEHIQLTTERIQLKFKNTLLTDKCTNLKEKLLEIERIVYDHQFWVIWAKGHIIAKLKGILKK